MMKTEPEEAETKRIVFADPGAVSQELLSRCRAPIDAGGGQVASAASAADFRHTLATEPDVPGIAIISPVDAFLESISAGRPVQDALHELRSAAEVLMDCLRTYRDRVVLIYLSDAAPARQVLARTLDMNEANFEGFAIGDRDPILRAIAWQALVGDSECWMALEFLEASSAIPVQPASAATSEDAMGAYLSLKQNASDAAGLRAELLRREAAAKRTGNHVRALTKEIADLESKVVMAIARADAAADRETALSQKVATLEARIRCIRSFWTVRATKPLRQAGALLRKVRHG